jgi:hypothetical protein
MMKKVTAALARLSAAIPSIFRDVLAFAGVALISYGAWMILPAAGFIVAGVLLLAGVILASRGAA